MKLLLVGGAAIPALVSITVIVASQYVPTDGSDPQDPGTAVVAEGESEAGTCPDGEDCETYVAGRDEDLSPPDAPLDSNIDPGDLLDLLPPQTNGFGAPGFQDGLPPDLPCSSPLSCGNDLPAPLPTIVWTGGGSVNAVDDGQSGEPLELVGHGTRDAEFGGSSGVPGPPTDDADGDGGAGPTGGGTGGIGNGSGAAGFLTANNDHPPAVVGPGTSLPDGSDGGSSGGGAFLNASNRGNPTGGSEPDPTVKAFVEELLLGGGGPHDTDGGDGQPPSELEDGPGGGQPGGPGFDDVLALFADGEEDDEYDSLARGSEGGDNLDLAPSEVPEPANVVMVGTGLLIAAAHLRRRRRT